MNDSFRPRTAPLPFSESIGFLIRNLNRLVQRDVASRIREFGVPHGAWYFLRVLWEEDGLTQSDLSTRLGMMEPTAVIALRGMEEQGWIRRVRSEQDKRKVHIYLTLSGSALREKILPIAHYVNGTVAKGMTQDEVVILRALLRRAILNFASEDGASPPATDDTGEERV